MEKRHGIQVRLNADKLDTHLGDELSVILFQSVREMLINVTKHAKAKKAELTISQDDNRIRIKLEDDGVGFDSSETGPRMDRSGHRTKSKPTGSGSRPPGPRPARRPKSGSGSR